jgi:response regulator NasT
MKPLRVVIADDDGVTLMVLRRTLAELGHQIVGEAANGQQALALVKEHNPDLAVLDIRMPLMDGFAASRAIQENNPTAVIVVSAHTEAGLGSEAASAGVDAYLVKPFTAQQLVPAIELALANKKRFCQMNEQLENRKVIERAKGILMRQTGMDEEAAYLTLQKAARNENKKMADIARALILADQLRQAAPSSCKPK